MKKVKCDDIHIKILLNQIDALKVENERLKRELWQVNNQWHCFNTVTLPLLKGRLEFEMGKYRNEET